MVLGGNGAKKQINNFSQIEPKGQGTKFLFYAAARVNGLIVEARDVWNPLANSVGVLMIVYDRQSDLM